MKQLFTAILTAIFSTTNFAQTKNTSFTELKTKKSIETTQRKGSISIDGILNEDDWKHADTAKDFIMFDPDNGKPEHADQKTEVKVLYDNSAVYIGAMLYDSEPKKILKEITERDNIGAADFFGVFINGFNDGQQEYSFFVTASNGQGDCIRTTDGEDFSWDAIWNSKAKITDKGWVVEMRIPYAALRFPKNDIQKWGIQFFREVRRFRQKFTWNRVDNKAGSFTQQAGELNNIKNISPPTRLFIMPYLSFYSNTPPLSKTTGTLKGGLDIKYGVTDAFTLDAILIPDFGQTKFDDQILNLGPFEQQFNENRPFFTEGTDLFQKGGLFYSRRIGGSPIFNIDLEKNEKLEEPLPGTIKLVNGLKFSGRTNKGLGIGILNAITENTNITIVKNDNGIIEKRRETLEPLTNYNVLVVDKRFNQNSSISFVNTNVARNGSWQDANAYALVFDLNTKKNTFNLSGATKHSIVQNEKSGNYTNGFANEINFAETAGKVRFNVGAASVSKDYNINDLGINFLTNYYEVYGGVNYRILKSSKKLNSFRMSINGFSQFNAETHRIQEQNFNINAHITNKKNHSAGMGINIRPSERYNYYDPRVEGRYIIYPKSYSMWTYISSNYNNKFVIDVNPFIGFAESNNWWYYNIRFTPSYRFNDRLMLSLNNSISGVKNELGWTTKDNGNIIFADRNRLTYETGLVGKYSINSKMNFALNTRYYWSYAENNSFNVLNQDGRTSPYNLTKNVNSDFKSWNTDLSFSWWFTPGSQMNILYRNSAADGSNQIEKRFVRNFETILNEEKLNHNFSVSVRYFLDYNHAKRWIKKA